LSVAAGIFLATKKRRLCAAGLLAVQCKSAGMLARYEQWAESLVVSH
jgi:hypothetical protein